jgi:diphthine-ammonia ligase
MQIPLYQRYVEGTAVSKELEYQEVDKDEVEDLFRLLKEVIKENPDIKAVSVGAICSRYQAIRVENVANRLGLRVMAYLWMKDQQKLVEAMIQCGISAIVIKTATLGLDKRHIGMEIQQILPDLIELNKSIGINIAGEGGEYETLVLNCPIFHSRIVIDKYRIITHSNCPFSPVFLMKPEQTSLNPNPVIGNEWKDILKSFMGYQDNNPESMDERKNHG